METTENKYETSRHFHGHRRRGGWIALAIVGFAAFVLLFGAVIMWLWNWLMPAIFSLGIITYWQAVGLAILGRLLFGGMHHGHHYHGHHRFGGWRFRHRMGDSRCCGYPGTEKWGYYEEYWNEEGEKAFEEYIRRKKEAGSASTT